MAFNAYIFDPGISSIVTLPLDGSRNVFKATLKVSLSGGKSFVDEYADSALDPCYGKYGIRWKWSTFESNSPGLTSLSATFTPFPSSWSTMQCLLSAGSNIPDFSGKYPKKWAQEPALSSEFFNPLLSSCYASSITWTLSTTNWTDIQIIPLSVSENFEFPLSFFNNGEIKNTASLYKDTIFTLNAQLSVICASITTPNVIQGDLLSLTHIFTAVAPPNFKVYTPNRYVLSGTQVSFQNLITNINLVSGLSIDFDDGKTVHLTGNDIKNSYFSENYQILGYKTLKLTAYTTYTSSPFTITFPNIIKVIDIYDIVSPSEYRPDAEGINLPWPIPPTIGSNEIVNEDNINHCLKQFYDNLNYLNSRSKTYNDSYTEYYGYLGSEPTTFGSSTNPIWTWEDADCLNTLLPYTITWRQLLSSENTSDNGEFIDYGTWQKQECLFNEFAPDCTEKGSLTGTNCLQWSWKSRKSTNTTELVTWSSMVSTGIYAKKWRFEICPQSRSNLCNNGIWQVNIPQLDLFYNTLSGKIDERCTYFSATSHHNKIYLAHKNQIRLLSSDRDAFFYSNRDSFDGVINFVSIESIRLDSKNKIYVLDSTLCQVAVYTYETDTPGDDWYLFTNWGGPGSTSFKFFNPQDLHIDQLDNVWVADTGNNSVKHYSNTGTWIKTIRDEALIENAPLSICVDSQKKLHVLTNKEIRIYSYEGVYENSYTYSSFVNSTPQKINTSYNREVIYLITNSQALKFFRNGIFFSHLFQDVNGISNITDIYQDEYRNLLITSNNKIIKYVDLMTQTSNKGDLPTFYWELNDTLIHKEEYIQNWVYSKSFQRLWDNIELFRNSLFFKESGCKKYQPPTHTKEKMVIGQNEIVTSTTVNRILKQLWDNFYTLYNFFDPKCTTTLNEFVPSEIIITPQLQPFIVPETITSEISSADLLEPLFDTSINNGEPSI